MILKCILVCFSMIHSSKNRLEVFRDEKCSIWYERRGSFEVFFKALSWMNYQSCRGVARYHFYPVIQRSQKEFSYRAGGTAVAVYTRAKCIKEALKHAKEFLLDELSAERNGCESQWDPGLNQKLFDDHWEQNKNRTPAQLRIMMLGIRYAEIHCNVNVKVLLVNKLMCHHKFNLTCCF